jgi:hypothetical protein
VRALVLLACIALLTGCGGHKPHAYATANAALLDRVPVYPGAGSPATSASSAGTTAFAVRDWTLPAGTRATTVVDWTIARLQAQGWNVVGKSFNTIRATRSGASLSVGVRGRTLEAIANSRGG